MLVRISSQVHGELVSDERSGQWGQPTNGRFRIFPISTRAFAQSLDIVPQPEGFMRLKPCAFSGVSSYRNRDSTEAHGTINWKNMPASPAGSVR